MNTQDAVEHGSSDAEARARRSLAASVAIGAAAFFAAYVVLGTILILAEGGSGARPTGAGWLVAYLIRSIVQGGLAGYVAARRRGPRWVSACGVLAALAALFSILFAAAFGLYTALVHVAAVFLGGWVASRRAV